MVHACVTLVHATPCRWRYRLVSAAPIAWERLASELAAALPAGQWRWRLNRCNGSLVLHWHGPVSAELSGARQRGWQAVLQAMERSGAVPPPPPLVRLKPRPLPAPASAGRRGPSWPSLLRLPLDLLSLSVALSLLALAALLALLGVLGLLLPLLPGTPLLLLAWLLLELALALRRPFVGPAPA